MRDDPKTRRGQAIRSAATMTLCEIANTVTEMRGLLATVKKGFVCERIGMAEAQSWELKDGAISHASGGFFSVVGTSFGGPDTSDSPHVLLHQPQSALNGLVTATIDDELHFLLQARVEPGNVGVAQYGPTVQSTPANYLRVHGGKRTPYLNLLFQSTSEVRPTGDWSALDLGQRYLFKNKRLVYVHAAEPLPTSEGFVWVSAGTVKAAVLESTLLNTDLRSMFSVMPWTEWPRSRPKNALGAAIHRSLDRPLRAEEVIGPMLSELRSTPAPVKLKRLDELESWTLGDDGLFENEPTKQGFDVHFFRIEAASREVAKWTQPLVNSRSTGRVVLAVSTSDGVASVLVKVDKEFGLSTGVAVFPSVLTCPGQVASEEASAVYQRLVTRGSAVVARTLESDEGGRFFQDASDFEVWHVSWMEQFGENYYWITLAELKFLLSLSNVCALQLRCISSVLVSLY